MFERFTARARHVVVEAQEAARRLNHDYIGPEHIFVALAGEREGAAAEILAQFEINQAAVESLLKPGSAVDATGKPLQFTTAAKRVLEHSLREALQLGHNYIGTEHLLLAVLRPEEPATAKQLVRELGKHPDSVLLHIRERAAKPESSLIYHPNLDPLAGTQYTAAQVIRLLGQILRLRGVKVEITGQLVSKHPERAELAPALIDSLLLALKIPSGLVFDTCTREVEALESVFDLLRRAGILDRIDPQLLAATEAFVVDCRSQHNRGLRPPTAAKPS